MSSSQLKLHSAWFVAPYFNDNNNLIGADYIRTWLGDFRHIKNIGKYAMRLGQALSSTTDTIRLDDICVIEDIERNGYCFSDGIGLISYNKAKEVSEILKLDYVPSALQIRIGGFKGVVSVYKEDAKENTKLLNQETVFVNKKYMKYKKICLEARKTKQHELNLTEAYTWYKKLPLIRIDLTKSEETIDTRKESNLIKFSKSFDVNTNFDNDFECINGTQNEVDDNFVNKNKYYHEKAPINSQIAKELKTQTIKNKTIMIEKLNENGVLLRKSMKKFESNHKILEVITHSQNIPGYLNRQIILILNSLGISNSVFMEFMDQFIYNKLLCIDNLPKYINEFVYTENNENEKFFVNMLEPIFYKENNDIVKKSKVFVCKSRILMGILDEKCLLKPNEVFIQCSPCRSCVCGNKENKIITGSVSIAKNPCLHPGDIRIVKGVDIKELHYLKDVIVFSSQGDRPVFNMCSGSDLDGDCYFCTWDNNLIPKKTVKPDTYSSNTALYKEVVSMDDIINFYIKFIKENQLGLIANAHLAISDRLTNGVLEPESIKLAKLFNLGVDFPKTGFLARIPYDLQPEVFPDFMEQGCMYKSNKILGLMYRRSLMLSKIKYPNCECLEQPTTYLRSVYNFRCTNLFKDIEDNNMLLQINYFEKETKETFMQYKSDFSLILSAHNIENENNAFLNLISDDDADKNLSQDIKTLMKKYKTLFYTNIKIENNTDKKLIESKKFFKAFSWYKISLEECKNKYLSFGWINGGILNENIGQFKHYKSLYSKLKIVRNGNISKADKTCQLFTDHSIEYKKILYCDSIIFVQDIKALQMLNNHVINNYYIDKDLLVIRIDFAENCMFNEFEIHKKNNESNEFEILTEVFLILFALRFFEISEFTNYFSILNYFAKIKNEKKEICKGFFDLSKFFYMCYEEYINHGESFSVQRILNINERIDFKLCNLFDPSEFMQKSNFLLAAAKIFSSKHNLGTKLIACENLYFDTKKRRQYKIEKTETTYKKRTIELVLHGMFDSFDRIFFVPYTDDCLYLHKNAKKYTLSLLNKGDCSVESYKDNLRSFLLNNAGYDTKNNTLISVKIYQGKFYFFDVSTYCINNNILISEVEKLIDNSEYKRKNNESAKGYYQNYQSDDIKSNECAKKYYNNYSRNDSKNNIYRNNNYTSSENVMFLNSYFFNSHDLVKNDLEKYIKKERMEIGKKERYYKFTLNKDKKRYALYLKENKTKMKVIKITKNRNICGRFYIVNGKDTMFEMIKEEIIFDSKLEINKLKNEEEYFLEDVVIKKCIETNEIIFEIGERLSKYDNFRFEENTTCELSREEEHKKTGASNESIYNLDEIKHKQNKCKINETYLTEKQKIDSYFSLCIKKIYKIKGNNKNLELESTKMSCEGKVSKNFEEVNFRTFDVFFEEIWNLFIQYIDSIKK